MKKNNKIKKSVSMLAFLFVCAVSVILSSCSDELDIQQSYPFKVETMPVPKDIVRGQTVEIRCELKAEGKFDGTIYTIRYFQHDGKGSLRMENGTVFQPNDRPDYRRRIEDCIGSRHMGSNRSWYPGAFHHCRSEP